MASKALLRLLLVVVAVGGVWMIFWQNQKITRLEGQAQRLQERLEETVADRRTAATHGAETVRREPRASAPLALLQPAISEVVLASAVEQWVDRVNLVKARLAQTPEFQSPLLALATPHDWLLAAFNNNLETDTDYRKAFDWLKFGADNRIGSMIVEASTKFRAVNGTPPSELAQLIPYFSPPLSPDVFAAYQKTHTNIHFGK